MKKILGLFFYFISCDVFSHDYYCSRSDTYLHYLPNPGASYATLSSGNNEFYSAYQSTSVGESSPTETVSFGIEQCSNENYQCLHFLGRQYKEKDFDFYLFLPNFLEANREYDFKGAKMLTRIASISPFLTETSAKPLISSVPILQATIWQNINGQHIPIKITVAQGKGVIFWDGIRIGGEKNNIGETCVLQSDKGFFSDVKIQKIVHSGSKVD